MRTLLAVALIAIGVTPAQAEGPKKTLHLPITLHWVTELTLHHNGQPLTSWITPDAVRRDVLPELNRIWSPAAIQFDLKSTFQRPAKRPTDSEHWTHQIESAKRNASGKSDPARITAYDQLIDYGDERTDTINVYLVPFLGSTSQGHTRRSLRRILIGQMTDKTHPGTIRPVQLVEPLPFKEGSFSRTLAHELGHVLNLSHPAKSGQKIEQRLMGGKHPGYQLTPAEVRKARQAAKDLLQKLPLLP